MAQGNAYRVGAPPVRRVLAWDEDGDLRPREGWGAPSLATREGDPRDDRSVCAGRVTGPCGFHTAPAASECGGQQPWSVPPRRATRRVAGPRPLHTHGAGGGAACNGDELPRRSNPHRTEDLSRLLGARVAERV